MILPVNDNMDDKINLESPLDEFMGRADRSLVGDHHVKMIEEPFLGYVNLRGNSSNRQFTNALGEVIGIMPPVEPNVLVCNDNFSVCWLGPDEWMLITPKDAQTDTISSIRDKLGGIHHAVTDTTGYYTMIKLSGQMARATLEKGCTLDLHPQVFTVGQCAQINIAKTIGLVIPRLNDQRNQSFDIVVRRSFADYLASWIEHSSLDYGIGLFDAE